MKIRAEREEERKHGGKRIRVTVVEREKEPEEIAEDERRQKEADILARLAAVEADVAKIKQALKLK